MPARCARSCCSMARNSSCMGIIIARCFRSWKRRAGRCRESGRRRPRCLRKILPNIPATTSSESAGAVTAPGGFQGGFGFLIPQGGALRPIRICYPDSPSHHDPLCQQCKIVVGQESHLHGFWAASDEREPRGAAQMSKKIDAIWWIVVAAGMILAINMGIRQTFGLFLKPITTDLHVNRQTFAFSIALLNLLWGAGSPFAGALSDKFGARGVVLG